MRTTSGHALTLLALLVPTALQQAAAEETVLDTVTVSAEQAAIMKKKPNAAFVLTRQEIERYNETTVGALLRKLPNVSFSGPPGQVEDIRVMGLDKGYTEILIDGQRVPGGTKERQLQVSRLPAEMIERIELIQVPTADMEGAGVGGTINIVLRKDKKEGGWFNVGVGKAGSHSPLRGAIGQTFVGDNVTLSLMGALTERNELKEKSKDELTISNKTHALEQETEVRKVSDYTFAPRLSWQLRPDLELTVDPFFNRSDETKNKFVVKKKASAAGVVSANGTQFEREDKVRDIARLTAGLKGTLAGEGSWYLRGTAQETTEDKDKVTTAVSATNVATTTSETSTVDDQDFGLSAGLERAFGDHTPSAGMSLNQSEWEVTKIKVAASGVASAAPKENTAVSEEKAAVWLQDSWRIADDHLLTLGVRHEEFMQDNGDKKARYSFSRPSLQYAWQLTDDTKLRLAGAEALRMPKLEQIANFTETKSGTSSDPDKAGNPDLRPETSWNTELALEHRLGDQGRVGLNWSRRDISDLIEEQTKLEGSRYVKRAFNVGDATAEAISLEGNYRFLLSSLGDLELGLAYSHLDSSVKDSSTGAMRQMKGQPKYTWKVDSALRLRNGWSTGMTYTYQGKINQGGEDDEVSTESEQKLLDVYISKALNKHLTVKVTGANLLDTQKVKYKTSTTKLTTEVEDGRPSYWVSLEGKW
ncbi:MAG: TonB-dependent receptor [Pseudogulbenkiania sp.]|nr:TonB-dependent receptor [Pseudogulbenkiania sp.]